MSPRAIRRTLLAFAAVAVMVAPLPALAAAGAAPTAVPVGSPFVGEPAPAVAVPGGAHLLAAVHSAMARDGIPATRVFLPNLDLAPHLSNGVVQPLYSAAPAPMGLGYFGVQDIGGHNVGTVSYTSSVKAAVTLRSVDPFYLASTSPDIFTMQLNTVATNVDVLNNTTGAFWIQNVPVYYATSHTLSFEDNIWNFTAPGAGMNVGTLYNYSGNLVPGVFYYALGPTFHIAPPFSIDLYNNASVFQSRPTIWFNYTITTSHGRSFSGSYDRVEFNSSPLAVPPVAPAPTYQIDGKQTNAFGLLNDAEIMIGGPGGGSTTTFNDINATMGLWTQPNGSTRFVAVPAGYDLGTDTGETSEGIAEWASPGVNPVANLGPGPSILQPLWGLVGSSSGFIRERFTLTPSNAFVFASEGRAFHPATAAWAPVPPSGTAVYDLAAHQVYSFQFLLADHRAKSLTVSGPSSQTISLRYDATIGVDTPLWAWDNAQLAAISLPGGNGTVGNPYVLDNQAVGSLNPLFGEFNDYYFPVFPGILLAHTHAYVSATGLSDFPVAFVNDPEAASSARFGTPYTNNLGLQFFDTTHVSLANNAQLTGWSFYQDSYMSSVLFWNSSNALVAGNHFQVQSVALQLFGGTNNVVWGNTFTPVTATAANPITIADAGAQVSLELYESGDTVYNNYFGTPFTAFTPTFNLYTGARSIWSDRWNVSHQNASRGSSVNGFNLSGNILGLPTETGNFWSDYGLAGNPYGKLPYDEYGAITIGGDDQPILPYALHHVTFTERGLPTGTNWTVTLNGYTQETNGTSLLFWEPSGTYAYVVGHVSGYTAHPASGAVVVSTHPVSVGIRWT